MLLHLRKQHETFHTVWHKALYLLLPLTTASLFALAFGQDDDRFLLYRDLSKMASRHSMRNQSALSGNADPDSGLRCKAASYIAVKSAIAALATSARRSASAASMFMYRERRKVSNNVMNMILPSTSWRTAACRSVPLETFVFIASFAW